MNSFVKAALVAAMVGVPLAVSADDEGDIKYRQAVMKGMSAHAGAISQIAKGKVSHTEALEGHAHALLELSKMVPAAFKNQTSGDSAAKPEVWSDRSGFEAAAGDLRDGAMAVAEASKSGPQATSAALGKLFDACKACHKEYRVKKD